METSKISKDRQALIIQAVTDELKKGYLFEDVAQEMTESIKQKLKKGNYDHLNQLEAFLVQIILDLRSISNDKHIWVMVTPPGAVSSSPAPQNLDATNYGFQKLKILHGNIGYMDNMLWFQEKTGPKKKMIPFGNDLFGLDEVFDIIRLQFKQNDEGKIVALQCIFPDGRRDQHDKNPS